MAADHTENLAKTIALSAATVMSIELTTGKQWIEVHDHTASTAVYVRVGESDAKTVAPTVAGDDCYVVLPGVPLVLWNKGAGLFCVKLISAGTPTITVQAADKP